MPVVLQSRRRPLLRVLERPSQQGPTHTISFAIEPVGLPKKLEDRRPVLPPGLRPGQCQNIRGRPGRRTFSTEDPGRVPEPSDRELIEGRVRDDPLVHPRLGLSVKGCSRQKKNTERNEGGTKTHAK